MDSSAKRSAAAPQAGKDARKPVVVGVGASAGGLEALTLMLAKMPEDCPMSFVVIQHLDPTHSSALAELLGRKTNLKVEEVNAEIRVQDGYVYVIPPDQYLYIDDCVIKPVDPDAERGSRRAVDYFFSALAADSCEHSIGIILSGTGNDGSAGLRDIKEVGGLVIAQDPKQATHAGMPSSALATGLVDLVLPAEEMADKLLRYVRHSYMHGPLSAQALQEGERDHLTPILQHLKAETELDFRSYRKKTILRRIQRRMGLAHVENLSEYLHVLHGSEDEAKALALDILINVTAFFRDAKAWEQLEQEVIRRLMTQPGDSAPLRIWVPGCATGEEAYSLAILLHEQASLQNSSRRFQIFATDIAPSALSAAREGFYRDNVVGTVSKERLRQYFSRADGGYQVSKTLRDCVAFAPHNVLTQPPFSNLDLISCRNLLIYFEPKVQKRLMEVFQFALKKGGYLFLGSSESIGRASNTFATVSKSARIFRRTDAKSSPPLEFGLPRRAAQATQPDPRPVARHPTLTDRAHRQMLEENEAAMAVVTDNNRALLLEGAIDVYLKLPSGELTPQLPDLVELCRDSLRSSLRSAIYRSRSRRQATEMTAELEVKGEPSSCSIRVRPLKRSQDEDDLFLISFELRRDLGTSPHGEPDGKDSSRDSVIQDLEHELSATREQLTNTIEEFETANEELKTSHEEAMSMNEELQSSNQELETSREELQSLNEELTTLNNQLEAKIEQLQSTTDDLDNILSSSEIATLFLDTHLRIRRFTPRSREFFSIRDSDIGRPFSEIQRIIVDDQLLGDARQVLESLKTVERQVDDKKGRSFIRRITPYRTSDHRIGGVVITLDEVTSLARVSRQLERREKQQAAIARLGQRALSDCGLEELMRVATRMATDVLEADLAKVLELLPESDRLLLKAGVGWDSGLVGQAIVGAGNDSQAGFTLRTRDPVIVEDLAKEDRFAGPSLLSDHGVTSGVSVIIGEPSNPYGVFGVHSRHHHRFSPDDVNFLTAIANILAASIGREQDSRAIRDSEERFRTIADNIAQLVWTADPSGHVYWYNQRWYEYTGTSIEEMKGWGWEKAHDPNRVSEVREKWRSHIESGEDWEDVFPLRSKNGEYRRFLSRAKPIRDENGKIVRWFGTNTDIERQMQVEEALRRSDQRKDEFLATLAHELRNPLAPIHSGLGVLAGGGLEADEQKEVVDIMIRQTRQLIRLIDDLMDASRISRGKVKIVRERASVERVLKNAMEAVHALLDSTEHEVELSLPRSPVHVLGDEARLTQVFTNLINNAARYSPPGEKIVLAVRPSGSNVAVRVRDYGRGIEPEMLDHIFDLFAQVDDDGNKTHTGLGIGLTLVKSLVELHGGEVSAASQGPGTGSEFTVTLPQLSEREAKSEDESRPAKASSPKGRRILVVDDNANAAKMLALTLKRKQHETHVAHSGEQALEEGERFRPHVVLLDVGMPGMDGIATVQAMREREWGKQTLIIATTGWGQDEDRKRTREAGFDHHLVKPIDLDRLLELIA